MPNFFKILAIAAVYFLAAKLGLSLAFVAEQVTAVWPPTGIAFALIVLGGARLWPGVWLGAFLINATANEPTLVAAAVASGNTLEAIAGAWLFGRVAGPDRSLGRVSAAFGLVVAAMLSTTIAATIGTLSLCVGGVQPWTRFTPVWLTWWLGDAMGDLLAGAALLAWAHRLGRPVAEKAGEFAALAASTLVTTVVIFSDWLPREMHRSLEYFVFPLLIWAALRFKQAGATLVSLIIAIVAIAATIQGFGPFALNGLHASLVLLLIFLGAVALTGLVLGAETAEREVAEQARHELLGREQEARAAAEEAVRQKDELVATVSHDLRTPLDAILGWTVMLRQGMLTPERAAQALETIERNARAQAQLIDDLLDLSRILAGRLQLRPASIDVRQLADAVGESLQPAAQAKQIAVTIDAEPIQITADAARLQQVVWNLMSNAIKFTSKDGVVQLRAVRDRDDVVISVRDNGIGIDPAFIPHLFQRFRQADRGSVAERGGLGLGLAIVRHLVELHGGTVSAHSDGEGTGAEFVVRLPGAHDQVHVLRA